MNRLTQAGSFLPAHCAGPDPAIFERGVHLVAVIYSITNFLFFSKII